MKIEVGMTIGPSERQLPVQLYLQLRTKLDQQIQLEWSCTMITKYGELDIRDGQLFN